MPLDRARAEEQPVADLREVRTAELQAQPGATQAIDRFAPPIPVRVTFDWL
jgi:hypothetical protein